MNQIIYSDYDILNVTLTTTYQEVTDARILKGFLVASRGIDNILHKRREADSVYTTILGGTKFPLGIFFPTSSSSLGWFRSETGSFVMEVYVFL